VLSEEGVPREGDRLREIAIQRGVPSESIIVALDVRNTAAEADALTGFAKLLNWKRVLLVTSASHMPRAMRLFRKCPAEVIPVPVGFQSPAPGQPPTDAGLTRYLPQAEALAHSERGLREYLGILLYSISFHEPRTSRQTH
jgi:uncharacterized SAM-binding protein YcdF (DUF218 family)